MAVVKESGFPFEVVLYGKHHPGRAVLENLVFMLDGPVENMVRKDATFRSLGLKAEDYVSRPQEVVDLLMSHIELMQRPILVRGVKAVIGRPKELVQEFLR